MLHRCIDVILYFVLIHSSLQFTLSASLSSINVKNRHEHLHSASKISYKSYKSHST